MTGYHSLADLDLPTDDPQNTRVVVAMSGGVDSAVATALVKEAGYDVIGMTMQLYNSGSGSGSVRTKTCCAGQDIYDARRTADQLDIPHYVVNYEAAFMDDVIAAFADSYMAGETPVPCVLCNQTVKFRDLVKAARDLGACALVTGHYVRRLMTPQGPELWQGRDCSRDQSYFLFATTREQLSFLRFPLGNLSKPETRDLARHYKLTISDKPDSQDICFVPDGNYARVVRDLRPESHVPGEIVHVDGTVVGRHDGIINFTVGQRRGLDVGGTKERLYVVRIDPKTRRVFVGPRSALGQSRFPVKRVNWLVDCGDISSQGISVSVRVRSSSHPVRATVFPRPANGAEVF